ncbi:hypothetical protein [Microbacterium murale]|uniref:Uncharacterized protein n=1 Tax=Microbacterium murale TaxID=1081040 RepID=A0ABU0PEA3_9MICO|nr:hypothetical protein [Microbacterium murale]MDQ0645666.1 hypothetical protein [Microbacterium murale]
MAKATANKYDFQTLTMREIAKIEELSKQGLTALSDDDRPKALALAAIAFVFRLRDDRTYTWNQAQDLTLKEIGEITSALGDLNISDGEDEEAEVIDLEVIADAA